MLWLVGAGPGDPELISRRGAELVSAAQVVIAEPRLWPTVRALRAAAGRDDTSQEVLRRPDAVARWPRSDLTVRLYVGDGLADSAADRAELARIARPFDLVAGLAADSTGATLDALGAALPQRRPLLDRSFIVTRPEGQSEALARPLRRLGATVVVLPTIRIVQPADAGAALRAAMGRLSDYRWLVLTSANGARAFLDVLPDARALAGISLAAIGPATAAVLREAHLHAELVPEQFVAEALIDEFPAPPVPSSRDERPPKVLLCRAEVARDVLPEGLRAAGWDLDVVAAYRTVSAGWPEAGSDGYREAEAAIFTSPSTLERFIELAGRRRFEPDAPDRLAVIVIGPVTAAAARRAGVTVDAVAERYDVAGLLAAAVGWAAATRPNRLR